MDFVKRLLKNKFVVVIGDSVQRSVYKDLVLLLNSSREDELLTLHEMRQKGEDEFHGDRLVEISEMTNAKTYREVRQYQTSKYLVRFYFVTRCYSRYFETILMDLTHGPVPDLILMSSCIWDVSRYGPNSMRDYKVNLKILFTRIKDNFPASQCDTRFIWLTGMPPGEKLKGGVLIPGIGFMAERSILKSQIREGNFYASEIADDLGIGIIDLHAFFHDNYESCRQADGIHWDALAHRRITFRILDVVSKSWGIKPPEDFFLFHVGFVTQVLEKNHEKNTALNQQIAYNERNYNYDNRNHHNSFSCPKQFPVSYHGMQNQGYTGWYTPPNVGPMRGACNHGQSRIHPYAR